MSLEKAWEANQQKVGFGPLPQIREALDSLMTRDIPGVRGGDTDSED